jgi:hypothetical protein
MRSAAPGFRDPRACVLVGVLMALCSAAPEAAAFLPASPARAGVARSFFPLSMAAKKATKKGAAAAKPHIEVNKKFVGLKQLSKDPAIFTIDGFFDQATCARYLAAGPAGEDRGESLKVDHNPSIHPSIDTYVRRTYVSTYIYAYVHTYVHTYICTNPYNIIYI